MRSYVPATYEHDGVAPWSRSCAPGVIGIVEKQGGLPLFNTDNSNFFSPTPEIIARLTGKISANLLITEGLNILMKVYLNPTFLQAKSGDYT